MHLNVYLYIFCMLIFKIHSKNLPEDLRLENVPVPVIPPQACRECGAPLVTAYISNGDKVNDTKKYPWIVSLLEKKNVSHLFCGGMLISEKFVITAGHCIDIEEKRTDENCLKMKASQDCFRPPESIYVGLLNKGIEGGDLEAVEVQRIIPHPEYTPQTYVHDIALIELKKVYKCDMVARPICLPFKSLSKIGQLLQISGWGKYDNNEMSKQMLMEGKVNEIGEEACLMPIDKRRKIICAIGNKTEQSSCQGDSGSAIFASYPVDHFYQYQYFALGVTSLGPPDCTPTEPDSYTDISAYMGWIKSVAKDLLKSYNETQLLEKKRKTGECKVLNGKEKAGANKKTMH